MYCPKCAAPIEGSKFCRSCGANVSLVPQALTGELPVQPADDRHGRRHGKSPSVEKAMGNIFTGIGFIFIALAIWRFMPGGFVWWFWMLIPAFSLIGAGVGQYLKVREMERQRSLEARPAGYRPPESLSGTEEQAVLSPPTTSELKAPGSIAEHTTRHLESEGRKKE